jgi:hypothetical protein
MGPMHDALLALVLSVLGPSPDAAPIARAIVAAVEADACNAPVTTDHASDAVLLAVFARRESSALLRPAPQSWDARAGRSAGPWQMSPSVAKLPLERQASLWLRWAREGGVAGLCGYGRAGRRIARQRLSEARAALTTALSAPAAPASAATLMTAR